MRGLISKCILLPASLLAVEQTGNPAFFAAKPEIRTFLYGDFFFASARQDGLTYASRSSDGNPLHGKYLEPSDRWRPGFRVGFGSHLAHDGWELSGDWTYFRSNLIQSAHAPIAPAGSTYLVPLFIDATTYSQFLGGQSVQEAKEQWILSYNALSFALTRVYFLSRELGIRPQTGLMAAWIDQDVNVSYRSNASPGGGGNSVVQCNAALSNDSWRVGPFLGAKLDWFVRRKFRFFGGAEAAGLYRHLHFQQIQTSVGNSNGDFRLDASERSYRIQPWVACQLGLAWNSFINRSRNFIEIALQYESQYFWHEMQSRALYQQIPGSQNRSLDNFGDLSLQSVAARLRLDF